MSDSAHNGQIELSDAEQLIVDVVDEHMGTQEVENIPDIFGKEDVDRYNRVASYAIIGDNEALLPFTMVKFSQTYAHGDMEHRIELFSDAFDGNDGEPVMGYAVSYPFLPETDEDAEDKTSYALISTEAYDIHEESAIALLGRLARYEDQGKLAPIE